MFVCLSPFPAFFNIILGQEQKTMNRRDRGKKEPQNPTTGYIYCVYCLYWKKKGEKNKGLRLTQHQDNPEDVVFLSKVSAQLHTSQIDRGNRTNTSLPGPMHLARSLAHRKLYTGGDNLASSTFGLNNRYLRGKHFKSIPRTSDSLFNVTSDLGPRRLDYFKY